jgi:hypothetical protein
MGMRVSGWVGGGTERESWRMSVRMGEWASERVCMRVSGAVRVAGRVTWPEVE